MKTSQPKSHSARAHQTVTKTIKLKTGKKTIRILPSLQKLSAHAGQTTFWGFLQATTAVYLLKHSGNHAFFEIELDRLKRSSSIAAWHTFN